MTDPKTPDSEIGYCPIEDKDGVVLTPGRLNRDQLICFSCGGDVNAPLKTRPLNAVDVQYSSMDATPPIEDMVYDARVEVAIDEPAPAVAVNRERGGKRARRRARQARLADLAGRNRVVLG